MGQFHSTNNQQDSDSTEGRKKEHDYYGLLDVRWDASEEEYAHTSLHA